MTPVFEIGIIIISLIIFGLTYYNDKKNWRVIPATIVGIFLFEYVTQALWYNVGLASWSYIYLDVNWIITLGWANIIIGTKLILERAFPKISEAKHFIFHLIFATVIAFWAELLVRFLGIREYAPIVYERLSGILLFGLVPVEAFYYIPTFMALVIAFSRYKELSFVNKNTRRKN